MPFRRKIIGASLMGVATLAVAALCAGRAAHAADVHEHPPASPASESAPAATNRSLASYAIPDVLLTRQDGRVVKLRAELDDDRPVVMAFIYTTCATVCPLTSHTLSELQTKLGADRDRVHLVSISIDPEQDTPARLREYAKTFGAGPEWQYYTGTLGASETVQRAFDVYRGAKMDHSPTTLVRPAPGAPWVRLGGFATADQLFAELPDAAHLSAAR
jgi:protein SCO1/2